MRRLVPFVSLLALAAACGGSAHRLDPKALPTVVLQPRDLPAWTRFENDPGLVADAGFLGSRDRTGAWIARFRSPRGIVVSRVDLYRTASAAGAVFEKLQSHVETNVRSLPTPALGDERVGYVTGSSLKLESIFWRRANAIGSIVVEGRDPRAVPAGALATTMDERLRKNTR